MTLNQLRTFALVARLGSLRAAAAALGISEPAVSSSLAALRLDLGDALVVRSGSGIALTAGGRALADHAQEIVGLADQVRWEVAHAAESAASLRVVATAGFAEHAAGRLFDAFTRRVPGQAGGIDVVVESADDVGSLLQDHAYDVALGSRPPQGTQLDVVPFLRYQRVLVAAPEHPLGQRQRSVPLTDLLGDLWFTGPAGVEEFTAESSWLAAAFLASGIGAPDIVPLSSETDALGAVRAGEGIMLAFRHIVRAELAAGSLVVLSVPNTPVAGLWCASTLDHGRATAAARTLQRFVTTAEATAAMLAPGGSRGVARRGSKVHVALWS
ncbi:LysR family transcriptional regulator [Cryobacterium sp. TMT1-3]|uniref:LysR family transcriptional regulator n=1 Tax=Cryobacterium luteum TaxID=1424661 RepID=A0A1H8E9H5_9MICO|nr:MULTISPECIES: LysR family transcriptional regulator [Cryobacterium]TFB89853.1 LysR family transcriptional regulator [Cryobacterium luteum]TFC25566.1 LysR family transcriptional regulator [Cryobacterium sp. TMT1-3]SEN16066.1 transcriptional regulator, LysR family [Cryobacterium luteum]